MAYLLYVVTGFLVGITSGLFGIGGGLITTPILKLCFGLPALIALATPLPVIVPTAVSGSIGYMNKGVIRRDIAIPAIIGGLPATIFGSYLTKFLSGKFLMILTGLMIIGVGIKMLFNKTTKNQFCERGRKYFFYIMLVGLIAGFVSGLLAIGGGIILIPAFIMICGLTMQEAAATSLVCIAFFAIPGSITHALLGHIDWKIFLAISVGVIPATFLGTKIALKLKSRQLQLMFSIFLIIFGVYFSITQFY